MSGAITIASAPVNTRNCINTLDMAIYPTIPARPWTGVTTNWTVANATAVTTGYLGAYEIRVQTSGGLGQGKYRDPGPAVST